MNTQLKPTLGTLHLWGIAVGLVISGEYFGWSYGWGVAGTLGFLVTSLMVAAMYTCFIFSFTEPTPAPPAPTFDSSQLSSEISSLEAELAHEQQLYAKRPRIYRLNAASTMRDKGAWYKDEWRKKVERIGNLNYPDEARRQQIYGNLRLLVSINRDGTLYEVQVLESSGQPLLDQAAQRIVRLAAPFAPFTGDLNDIDRLEIIRTWRFAKGDRLSSN